MDIRYRPTRPAPLHDQGIDSVVAMNLQKLMQLGVNVGALSDAVAPNAVVDSLVVHEHLE